MYYTSERSRGLTRATYVIKVTYASKCTFNLRFDLGYDQFCQAVQKKTQF